MDHSFDFHKECLAKLCRVCGKRSVTRKQKGKLCANVRSMIFETYNIDTINDNLDIHSDKICGQCYKYMYNRKRKSDPFSVRKTSNIANIWIEHKRNSKIEYALILHISKKVEDQ